MDAPRPPTTERPTSSSLKVQLKKLKAPFRCPVVDPTKAATGTGLVGSMKNLQKVEGDTRGARDTTQDGAPGTITLAPPNPLAEDKKIQHRTTRASLQFKSPLLAAPASEPPSGVRLTPKIQALQRQLQTLKRAVKVRQANEEEELKGLVKTWKEAAREVAWAVWEIYTERGLGQQGDGAGGTVSVSASWGWEEKKGAGSSWGWAGEHDEPSDVQATGEGDAGQQRKDDPGNDEEEARDDTMGTMLRQLGVDPESLGWDVEQDCFVDGE